MTDPATTARNNAISVEAKLTGHAKRSDGGLNLRFAVHPHDIPDALRDAPIGTRYLIALVEIGDNEEPVVKPQAKRDLPLKPPQSTSPAQQAGILCNDPSFRRFLAEETGADPAISVWTSDMAADYVRRICGVASRSEIKPGTTADLVWNNLHTRFLWWLDQ